MLIELTVAGTVVDPVHGEATLATHPEARRPGVTLADRLVFSKTDVARPSSSLLESDRHAEPDGTAVRRDRCDAGIVVRRLRSNGTSGAACYACGAWGRLAVRSRGAY